MLVTIHYILQSSYYTADNINMHNRNECTYKSRSDCRLQRVCVPHTVNKGMNVSIVSPYNPNSRLNPSQLSLPYFEDCTKINAVFHLK
jgi:hypothetical protein